MASFESDSSKWHPSTRRRSRRKPKQPQKLSSYLSFGVHGTVFCLIVFVVLYSCLLLFLSPLLTEKAPETNSLSTGSVLKPVVAPWMDKIKNIPHAPKLADEVVGFVKDRIQLARQRKNITDDVLMEKAIAQLNRLRRNRDSTNRIPFFQQDNEEAVGRRGIVVLGMHRSGTSMLSGLLVNGFGYNVGGPLIGSSFDNEKGFFERIVRIIAFPHSLLTL